MSRTPTRTYMKFAAICAALIASIAITASTAGAARHDTTAASTRHRASGRTAAKHRATTARRNHRSGAARRRHRSDAARTRRHHRRAVRLGRTHRRAAHRTAGRGHHRRFTTGAAHARRRSHHRARVHTHPTRHGARAGALLAAADHSSPPTSSSSTALTGLTFAGSFNNTLASWTAGGGAAQCANYGTPSKYPRLRGTLSFDNTNVGSGIASGVFTLPADTSPSTYPLEACDVVTRSLPNTLGTDSYEGIMVYVPLGWTIANHFFTGVNIEQYRFQNIYGSPITLELHPNHVTIALETGGCFNHATATPGCQFRSNADNPPCRSNSGRTCLPGYYAIPPGAFVQGAWNEIMLHVHWASDSTGSVQSWYRTKGQSTWMSGNSFSGIPTVQWDNSIGCCGTSYRDLTEAYTAALSAPVSVWLDNVVSATSFAAVASTMP